MSSSGYSNLESRNLASNSGNGANVSHGGLHFTNCLHATNHHTIPSSLSSADRPHLRASKQHDNTDRQPSAAQNCSQSHPSHSECPSREGREMPPSCYNSLSSNHRANDSFQFLSKSGIPEVTAPPVASLEFLLDTLSVFQQKIQQVQALVQLMSHGTAPIPQQQQLVAAGITSMISELIVASACLMQRPPSGSTQISASNPQLSIAGGTSISGTSAFKHGVMGNSLTLPGNFLGSTFEGFCAPRRECSAYGMGKGSSLRGDIGSSEMDQNLGEQGLVPSPGSSPNSLAPIIGHTSGVSPDRARFVTGSHGMDVVNQLMMHGHETFHSSSEDHDAGLGLKDDDDDDESLPPDSYELVEMDAAEILAEHTHFCEICGKGFKRDANLRMHMRGHGDEYKTPAALARPDKSVHALSTVRPRRFSCPSVGCKRNKKHHKFQPLKSMLCVKNHYRRSHCLKMLTCNKCKIKKFSVVADLRTHEKHCGRDKWQCSCGTTFSRKDKLLGHVVLFAGHVPALPLPEMESAAAGLETESGCFNSGHEEGWQGMLCNEAAQVGVAQFNLVLENESATNPKLIVGSSQSMGKESARGVGDVRSEGLQVLGHKGTCTVDGRISQGGSSCPSSLASAFVANSSIFPDLL